VLSTAWWALFFADLICIILLINQAIYIIGPGYNSNLVWFGSVMSAIDLHTNSSLHAFHINVAVQTECIHRQNHTLVVCFTRCYRCLVRFEIDHSASYRITVRILLFFLLRNIIPLIACTNKERCQCCLYVYLFTILFVFCFYEGMDVPQCLVGWQIFSVCKMWVKMTLVMLVHTSVCVFLQKCVCPYHG